MTRAMPEENTKTPIVGDPGGQPLAGQFVTVVLRRAIRISKNPTMMSANPNVRRVCLSNPDITAASVKWTRSFQKSQSVEPLLRCTARNSDQKEKKGWVEGWLHR